MTDKDPAKVTLVATAEATYWETLARIEYQVKAMRFHSHRDERPVVEPCSVLSQYRRSGTKLLKVDAIKVNTPFSLFHTIISGGW